MLNMGEGDVGLSAGIRSVTGVLERGIRIGCVDCPDSGVLCIDCIDCIDEESEPTELTELSDGSPTSLELDGNMIDEGVARVCACVCVRA